MADKLCFGFYSGEWVCQQQCNFLRQCKSFSLSDGLDVLDETIEALTQDLPDGRYPDIHSFGAMARTLMNPQKVLSPASPTTTADDPF